MTYYSTSGFLPADHTEDIYDLKKRVEELEESLVLVTSILRKYRDILADEGMIEK